MKAFSLFIGRLPLAGKLSIRPLFSDLYCSQSFPERLKRYFVLIGVLVLFIFAHGMQARMGIQLATTFNKPFWVVIIGGLYAIINLAVSVAQMYLAYKATRFLFRNRYLRSKSQALRDLSVIEILIAAVVTLSGQLIFGFLR